MMPNSDLFTKEIDERKEETKYTKRDSDLIIKDTNINIRLMLNAINERIEYIYDREHTIGHSYSMELLKKDCNTKTKLDEIFRLNIIPLLAEYFYGDWEDIKVVLNDTNNYFISKKESPTYVINQKRKNNEVYTINSSFSSDGYINIYQTSKENDEK